VSSLRLGPLVRYVDTTSASVWVETEDDAEVTVTVGERSWSARTFRVHGHHFALVECVGTHDAMATALQVARPGATVGYVGVPHGIELPVRSMFRRNVGVAGGMAPVRKYLPDLLERTLAGRLDASPVFDLTLPLEEVAEGYRAMDERRAIKVLLQP